MLINWIFCYIGVGTVVCWFMKLVDLIDGEGTR